MLVLLALFILKHVENLAGQLAVAEVLIDRRAPVFRQVIVGYYQQAQFSLSKKVKFHSKGACMARAKSIALPTEDVGVRG